MHDKQLYNEVMALQDEIISLRREFHSFPELGFKEFKTSERIASYLRELAYEVKTGIAGTGVSAVLRGNAQSPVLLLRGDIDALPIEEETELTYASRNPGVMHACGHDGHIAMLLVCAKVLMKHKNHIQGSIKFFFQPNEEEAGAQTSIDNGAMENPKADAVFGYHLWSTIETGKVAIMSGPVMASSYYLTLDISGRGGHAGQPEKAVNPIQACTAIQTKIQQFITSQLSPITHPSLVTFCSIHGGTTHTIIPEQITAKASIRCLHSDSDFVHNNVIHIAKETAKLYGCSCKTDLQCGNSLLTNDPKLAGIMKQSAQLMFGESQIIEEGERTMLGDDFAEFSKRVPGCYIFIGAKPANERDAYPHHHPKFDINEEALTPGVLLLVQSCLNFFD